MDVDVAVLGGGPGGYPAAIRASQLGLSVAVIEQGRLGGTCLNVGCIPTKALVQSAHAVKDAHTTFAQLGVKVSGVEIDWPQMQANKQQRRRRLVSRPRRAAEGERRRGRAGPRPLHGANVSRSTAARRSPSSTP